MVESIEAIYTIKCKIGDVRIERVRKFNSLWSTGPCYEITLEIREILEREKKRVEGAEDDTGEDKDPKRIVYRGESIPPIKPGDILEITYQEIKWMPSYCWETRYDITRIKCIKRYNEGNIIIDLNNDGNKEPPLRRYYHLKFEEEE